MIKTITEISNCLKSLFYGILLPFRSLAFILTKADLFFLSILPAFLTLCLQILLFIQLQNWIQVKALNYFVGNSTYDLKEVQFLLHVLIKFILFVLSALTFSMLNVIIASPLNDFLAEKTERYTLLYQEQIPTPSLVQRIRMIFFDASKSFLAALFHLLSYLLLFIPILSFFTLIIPFLLVTFTFLTYPQSRRNIGIFDNFLFLGKHFFACLGFGGCCSLLFSIPFLSCFTLPIAVVGGTLLFARSREQENFRLR